MIVRGDQDLVARPERQAVIHEREPRRGVGRERDLLLAAAEIGGHVFSHFALEVLRLRFEHPALDDQERILVDGLPEGVDGGAHGRGMRRDVEPREMHVVRRQAELGADLCPVVQARHRRRAGLHGGEQPARQQ